MITLLAKHTEPAGDAVGALVLLIGALLVCYLISQNSNTNGKGGGRLDRGGGI